MRVITVFISHNTCIVFSTEYMYTAFAATYVERCVRLGRSLGAARHLAIQRVVEPRHRYGKKIALAVWRCNGDLLERQ